MWKAAILLFLVSLGSAEAFSPGLAFQSTALQGTKAPVPSVASFGLSNRRSILQSTEGSAESEEEGALPGGLTPDQFKMLTADPDVMAMLQSPKIQEAMSLMMSGEKGALEEKVKEDPELQQTIAKLNSIMESVRGS
jgi:hypothetical protein